VESRESTPAGGSGGGGGGRTEFSQKAAFHCHFPQKTRGPSGSVTDNHVPHTSDEMGQNKEHQEIPELTICIVPPLPWDIRPHSGGHG
jgi:hypothetical protein